MSASAASAARIPVGAGIEVFWPMDNVFYKGTVSRRLPNAQHVILYDDGVCETLDLRRERYRILAAPAPPPQSVKKKPSVPSSHVPLPPPLDMDLVTYTPPVMPPRKRFRGRLLRSKQHSNRAASSPPKVLLKQRIRPSRTSPRQPKKLTSFGDVMSDFSNYTNEPPK